MKVLHSENAGIILSFCVENIGIVFVHKDCQMGGGKKSTKKPGVPQSWSWFMRSRAGWRGFYLEHSRRKDICT